MNKKYLLSISVIVNFFNEEKNLERLLLSLRKQNYPKDKIEYIFVDDSSTDNSLNLVKEFGGRIMKVNTHDIELNKGIGMHAARNEIVCWLDADMELCNEDFFAELTKPLIDNQKIIGSFTKEFAMDSGPKPKNAILRFISYDTFQRDPVFQFFSIPLERSFLEKKENYYICKFTSGKMPPVGRISYKRKELLKTKVGQLKSFIDMEAVETVTRAGHQLFAFTPDAKMRHYHAESLSRLIRKRLRNMERDYLPNINYKHFTWIDTNSPLEVLKILFWIIYVNLFIPEFFKGLILCLYYQDFVFLYQPIVSIAVTDSIIWSAITKKSGRDFAFKLISRILPKLINISPRT